MMETNNLNLKDKVIMSLIVILVGIHILNWNIKGIGWKGSLIDKFMQVLILPWSLI
jgi:hypothetical protein